MSYTPPPYEEYIKDWKIDKKNFQMTHLCGIKGRWLPYWPFRSSGINPGMNLSLKKIAKFYEFIGQRGITDPADREYALADLSRQVEEIYVRNFAPLLKEPKKKTHWQPVSNQSQPAVNTFHRINEGR